MKKLIYSITITWLMLFSVRVFAIANPLNLYEKIGLISVFIDYTLSRSKELEWVTICIGMKLILKKTKRN